MTTRKDLLMSYPSSITVEVSYKDNLPFSAITICNHNQYRLTAMQELGLYDLMVNDLNSKTNTEPSCSFYKFYSEICYIPAEIIASTNPHDIVLLQETTRSVCRRVCEDAYDWYCSGFLYDRLNRSCTLSPYTGEWVEANRSSCNPEEGMEFYRRNRCTFDSDIHCNFEDSTCSLQNDTSKEDQWITVEAAGHKVKMDNTLDLASGHVANLLLTELRPGYKARFQTPYMNTTGRCIELFYWLQVRDSMTCESATLSIIVITEERKERIVLERSKGPTDWSRLFVELPNGVHQVVIEGRRGHIGQSGISLDDIVIMDCNKFASNRNCKVTRRGRAYMGTINVTATGEPCLPWETISNPLTSRLPDKTVSDAKNYCRNIPQQNWDEPSCFVRPKSSAIRPMPCNIPYCDCVDSSYFKCDNGMCLPGILICNGFNDCLDGSDESKVCSAKRNVECYFDTDYKCGYESNNVGALRFTRVSASDLRYDYGAAVINTNVSALEQLMVVDSKLGQIDDQVQLVSPLWTFTHPTLLSITYIMMGSDTQPADSKAGLYLYQYSELRVPVRKLFSATSFSERALQVSEVCVPNGTYHLMFLGIQGIPYESDFALDIVKIVGTCVFEEVLEDESFNCTFANWCGYRFISSSALFSSSLVYTSNAFMKNNPNEVCSVVFGGVEGIIKSPGFPDNYDNNLRCNFSIEEPSGVTIEINFLEFAIEPESDCLFDRLEIEDPIAKRTKVYCGNSDLPPKFQSKGNILNILFITDDSVNNGRFKLSYKTPITRAQETDFALALKYTGQQPPMDYIHSGKLISPAITQQSNSCMSMILMAEANFTIKMAYIKDETYTEHLLLNSPKPLDGGWHRLYLNLSPSFVNNGQFVVVFEIAAGVPGSDAAIINDVKLISGSCLGAVTNGSIDCQFTGIEQCGYLDVSRDSIKWLRSYDKTSDRYFMRAHFDTAQPEVAVLQSVVSRTTTAKCLKITYYSSSRDITLKVSSLPTSFLATANEDTTNFSDQPTYGNAFVQQSLPVGNYSLVITAYLEGDSIRSGSVEELKIFKIEVLDGDCLLNVSQALSRWANNTDFNSYCTFDNPNLCGYTVNYPSGAPWIWAKFENVVGDDVYKNLSVEAIGAIHGNVMVFNGSHPHPLKGVLVTSQLVEQSSRLMMIEAFTLSNVNSSLEVYVETAYGHSYNKMTINGSLIENQFTNLTVCLPSGSFQALILATTPQGSPVAIDSIFITSTACTVSDPDPGDCRDPDLSNCQQNHFTWSPQFAWVYTADIRNDIIIPAGDGCIRVFYETEGIIVYNETGKEFMDITMCDIYIKGLSRFTVSLWFEEIEVQNCSQQYLQIWRNNGNNFVNDSMVSCDNYATVSSKPFVFQTEKVLQIRVSASDGFPRFRLHYKYTPPTMDGLYLALHYTDTKVSGTFNIDRVAQLASVSRHLNSDYVCLEFDMAFPAGLLEVVFSQYNPQKKLTLSKTVLQRTTVSDDHVSWSHGAFEIPVETSWNSQGYFVFYVSLANATFTHNSNTLVGALNNIHIRNGTCSRKVSDISLPSFCAFGRNNFCGYKDVSQETAGWVLQSRRATYITSGECTVSKDAREYVGNISYTVSGRHCQRWDTQTPHKHNQDVADYFPDPSLTDAADHCRNPSNPFIVRSSWCYTTDPNQRREYCDIPYCLDYVMEVQFLANLATRAVLESPRFPPRREACLRFRYQLTSALLELTVKRRTSMSDVPETLHTFSVPMEPTTYVWKDGIVNLPNGTIQIYFVADKTDYTEFDEFVSLDNISISEGACSYENQEVVLAAETVRSPYNGPKLSRVEYIPLILEELKGKDMQELTSKMAHQLPQLVHDCEYGQEPCTPETDFLTEFTDMGQCYTFNYNPETFRSAYTTGAESGARFIFNVEQYEHVKNYVSGVGVKMHLHDQSDIPSMRDLGLAAMPGVHNLATISYTQSESLPPPFGGCGLIDLPYFDEIENDTVVYTEAKCRMESKTSYIEQHCNCKDIHMPGLSPVCSLKQHMDCIKRVTDASLNISTSAVCPPSCVMNSFSLGLSQSQLSGLDIATLLGNKTEDVTKHYVKALEIRHRVDEDIMTNTIKEIESLINAHVNLKDYVYSSVLDKGTSVPRHVEAALTSISDLVLQDIVSGGGALLSKFEAAYLESMNPRESYLEQSVKTLHARLSLSKDLFRNLHVNSNALDIQWYFRIFNSTFLELTEFNKTLATYSRNTITTNGFLPKMFAFPPCKTYKDQIISDTDMLIKKFRGFINGSTAYNGTECDSCKQFVNKINEMLMLLANFSDCNSEYSGFLRTFRQWLGTVDFDFKEYSNSINSEKVLNMFMHNEVWLADLKRNYTMNVISKLNLTNQLLSKKSESMSQDITDVIQDITQQIVVPLQNKVTSTESDIAAIYFTFLGYLVQLFNYTRNGDIERFARSMQIWRKPTPNLELPEMMEFELLDSETWQVWPPEKSMDAFLTNGAKTRLTFLSTGYFSRLNQQLTTFLTQMGGYQSRLDMTITTMKSTLKEYLSLTETDDEFVVKNFLVVDIYYGEMKYEHISQSESYVWTNFFSDLGSYFGLLMGCSLLTMIEVLDLVIYYSIVKAIEVYQAPSRRREVVEVDLQMTTTQF